MWPYVQTLLLVTIWTQSSLESTLESNLSPVIYFLLLTECVPRLPGWQICTLKHNRGNRLSGVL